MAAKYDNDKPMVNLVPPEAILAMARVMTFGAKKYGGDNWRLGQPIPATRMYAAVLRHLMAWAQGEDVDPESGHDHLVHALTGLAMLWTKLKTQENVDDRWFVALKQTSKAVHAHCDGARPNRPVWAEDLECQEHQPSPKHAAHASPGRGSETAAKFSRPVFKRAPSLSSRETSRKCPSSAWRGSSTKPTGHSR